MTNYPLLTALGVLAVHEVPHLPSEVSYVADQRVGLIRAGLDPQTHALAVDYLTLQAARAALSSG